MTAIPIMNWPATSATEERLSNHKEWEIKQQVKDQSPVIHKVDDTLHSDLSSGNDQFSALNNFWNNAIRYKEIKAKPVVELDTEFSEAKSPETLKKLNRVAFAPVINEEDEDILDWDAYIEAPPPRRSGTIKVRFKYIGRSKPIPIDDPWA